MLYSLYAKDLNSSFVRYRLLIGGKVTLPFHPLTDVDSCFHTSKFATLTGQSGFQFLKSFNYTLLITTDTPPTFEYLTLHHPELLL